MAPAYFSIKSVASMLAMLPATLAGFDAGSSKSVAVYWGQDGAIVQERLGSYCSNSNLDIIPIAFMNGITPPITNFASASNACTSFPDNANVLNCPQIAEDIQTCQKTYGKTIMLSLGGSTYNQGGWASTTDAEDAAQTVWDMFGPVSSGKTVDRPFGSSVVDGFDFDFESATNNLPAFAAKLRSLMDAAGDKKYYLSAAPQCPFPDAADGSALDAVSFDFIMIQFYNNPPCGVQNFQSGTQSNFNFKDWDNWAKTTSPNKNIKLFLGIPATTAAGAGYVSGAPLQQAISAAQQFSSFGGVMMWDMAELFSNSGFLDEVASDLQGGKVSPQPTTTAPEPTTTTPASTVSTIAIPSSTFITSTLRVGKKVKNTPTSTTTSTTSAPTGALVAQWDQCGGIGYTGSTQCQPPYTCVYDNDWWSACK